MSIRARLSLFISVLLCAAACDKAPASTQEKPLVVTTTTMLADLAGEIGGEDVQVRGIMRPGGDPHLYQPTPGDARLIASSDLVITSGLHLEGWIDDLVRNAGGTRPVIVASDGIDAIRMEGSPGGVDPHFWFDLQAWKQATHTVGEGIGKLVADDPEAAKRVASRTQSYATQLDALDAWIRSRLETIPADRRVVVTSHDAFNYFARAYDIDVVGIQGISTEQEASQRDVANVIDLVRERGAPAVFVETSVNPRLIEQVARETGATIAGPLYSDSIGPQGSAASTFVGTVTENVRIITEALGGTYTPFHHPQTTSLQPTTEQT